MLSDLQVEVAIEDYRAFLSLAQSKGRAEAQQSNKPISAQLARFLIWFSVGGVIVLSINAFGGRVHIPSAVGATLLTFTIVVSSIYWQFQKLQATMEPRAGGAIIGTHHYQYGDDGILINSSYGTTQLAWKGIHNIEETPTHFFILIDRCVGFIVPKRSFSGAAQQAQFRNLAAARCRVQ